MLQAIAPDTSEQIILKYRSPLTYSYPLIFPFIHGNANWRSKVSWKAGDPRKVVNQETIHI